MSTITDQIKSHPTEVVTEIYQEDIHRLLRFMYRDDSVIEESVETIAQYVKQLHIFNELKQKQQNSLMAQLSELIKRLVTWCQANAEQLSMPYLAWPERQESANFEVYFFAVQNSNQYNEEFSRNLTRLEIEIEDSMQFSSVDLRVMELPKMNEKDVCEFAQIYTSHA